MKATLTQGEIDCIFHRLEEPDCLADALVDDEENIHDRDHILSVSNNLADKIRSTKMLPLDLTDLEKMILRDCVEGSTWLGVGNCEEQHSTAKNILKRYQRELLTAAKKIAAAIGVPFEELNLPTG